MRRAIQNPIVSTIQSGHYTTISIPGRAARPDAYAEIAEETVRDLHAKIGELAVANDFLSRKLKPWIGK